MTRTRSLPLRSIHDVAYTEPGMYHTLEFHSDSEYVRLKFFRSVAGFAGMTAEVAVIAEYLIHGATTPTLIAEEELMAFDDDTPESGTYDADNVSQDRPRPRRKPISGCVFWGVGLGCLTPMLLCCGLLAWVMPDVMKARELEENADAAVAAGDFKLAEENYRAAAQLQSSYSRPELYLKLGELYETQGREAELPDLYREGIRESDGSGRRELYYELILTLAEQDRLEEARKVQSEIDRLSPPLTFTVEQAVDLDRALTPRGAVKPVEQLPLD